MSDSLDRRTLNRLLREAGQGPSPYDLQPWRFLVVREPRNRRRLGSCARNHPAVGRAEVVVVVLGYHHPDQTHLLDVLDRRVATGASTPEHAAELQGRARAEFARESDSASWAARWAMTAVASLLCAAESLGVAATAIDGFDAQGVREGFGVPDDHAIACLVALGGRASAPFAERLALEETCFDEHFGRLWEG